MIHKGALLSHPQDLALSFPGYIHSLSARVYTVWFLCCYGRVDLQQSVQPLERTRWTTLCPSHLSYCFSYLAAHSIVWVAGIICLLIILRLRSLTWQVGLVPLGQVLLSLQEKQNTCVGGSCLVWSVSSLFPERKERANNFLSFLLLC